MKFMAIHILLATLLYQSHNMLYKSLILKTNKSKPTGAHPQNLGSKFIPGEFGKRILILLV
jgi:hypothetical protein